MKAKDAIFAAYTVPEKGHLKNDEDKKNESCVFGQVAPLPAWRRCIRHCRSFDEGSIWTLSELESQKS